MKANELVSAIVKLNPSTVVTIDHALNSAILSSTRGGFTTALAAFGATRSQRFQVTVGAYDLHRALLVLNPSKSPDLEVSLQVAEKPDGQALQVEVVSSDNSAAREYCEVAAVNVKQERVKEFRLDRQKLHKLSQKKPIEEDGYTLKAATAAKVTTKVTKKHGEATTISVPNQDVDRALKKGWELSICLMEGDRLSVVHYDSNLIAVERKFDTGVPTVAGVSFTREEWSKVRFATKLVASMPCRMQSDYHLTGVEFHTGSRIRFKGFSGVSIYSTEMEKASADGRFLIPQGGIEEFCRLLPEGDKAVSLYFKGNGQFLLTSESAALRGELKSVELYPSNWHELPISREVPAEFTRQEFLQVLSKVTRWPNWRDPADSYCRMWWEDDGNLNFQGVGGKISLRPKNKGYSTTPYKMYVSAVALEEIVEQLSPRFRLALPVSDTEMCRISDNATEAGLCVLHEPRFVAFKKEQQASPDAPVQETLTLESNDAFECRAIEINPIAQAEQPLEPGEIEEIDIVSEVADFARKYRDFRVFSGEQCPVAETVRDIFTVATPDGFAAVKEKMEKAKSRVDFTEYVVMLADLADLLAQANELTVEMLSEDNLYDLPRLRILWQASLNREYYRGYNAALNDVEKEAKSFGIEGIAEICDKLRSQLPDDLCQIAERLRVWIGRSIFEQRKLAPMAQVEFRPIASRPSP